MERDAVKTDLAVKFKRFGKDAEMKKQRVEKVKLTKEQKLVQKEAMARAKRIKVAEDKRTFITAGLRKVALDLQKRLKAIDGKNGLEIISPSMQGVKFLKTFQKGNLSVAGEVVVIVMPVAKKGDTVSLVVADNVGRHIKNYVESL
jgi:hypothetical protein